MKTFFTSNLSNLIRRYAASVVCALILITSSQTSGQTQLSFSGSPIVSGSPGAVNTTYTYNNIGSMGSTTIRGVIRIMSVTGGASLYTIDAASGGAANAWQPVINGPTTANGQCWSITFQVSFFDASNGFPLTLSSFRATGVDIDGDGSNLREYNEPYNLSSYTVENPTNLTVTAVSGGGYNFRSPQTAYNGISLSQTNVAATWYYDNIQSMSIKIGSCCSGGSCSATGSTSRQSSINFYDAVAYNVGTTILPVDFLKVWGRRVGETNYVNWKVARQINVVQYIVEKSDVASGPFSTVSTIAARDHDYEEADYLFKDEERSANIFYKITAIDKDGRSSSSNIIKITATPASENFTLLNDGRSPNVRFQMSLQKDESMTLRVTDYSGRMLHQQDVILRSGTNLYVVDKFHLPRKGVYFVQLLNSSGSRYSGKVNFL